MKCGRFAGPRRWLAPLGAAIWLAVAFAHPARAESAAAIQGASQYGESHVVTRTLERFAELVRQYYGKPIEFTLHKGSSRGLERQYFTLMSKGDGIDYAIVAPVHMIEATAMARLIDAPFLFRDAAHWNAALGGDALKPFAEAIAAKADVMIIGFAGGSTRHVFAVAQPADGPLKDGGLKGLTLRVPGGPPWHDVFEAVGAAPRVVPANALYNDIKKGAVAAAEGDAATIEAMKLYEVAPSLLRTAHTIAVRPICFSARAFKALPMELQEAILKAGAEAGAFGRALEQAEDAARLDTLEQEGRVKRAPFDARAALKARADPVLANYAKEIGAEALLGAIEAVK
jgi:TRAP-type C4-dicarboxylate transport system substrate-binding protein